MSVATRAAASPADRDRKYRAALRWLEKEACYLAADVMKLGRPLFVPGADTAYVALLDGDLLFGFDPRWFDELPERRLAAVLVHEALHVLLGHVFVRRPGRVRAWQLACDAVVNDLIARHYPRLPLPEPHVSGVLLIGRSTVGLTSEEVLDLLPPGGEACAAGCPAFDDHGFWGREGDTGAGPARLEQARLIGALEEIAERNQQVDRWGTEALGVVRAIGRRETPFDLEQLLLGRIGRRLRLGVQWTPPPRRLAAFHGEVLLPTYPEIQRLEVLLAVDASGSISPGWLSVFATLAQRPLAGCLVDAVSFDTVIYPFEPRGPRPTLQGGGGTDFQPIETWAAGRRRYPDVVIVLTDGWAPRPCLRYPERWIWCLSEERSAVGLAGLGELVLLPPSG